MGQCLQGCVRCFEGKQSKEAKIEHQKHQKFQEQFQHDLLLAMKALLASRVELIQRIEESQKVVEVLQEIREQNLKTSEILGFCLDQLTNQTVKLSNQESRQSETSTKIQDLMRHVCMALAGWLLFHS